MQLKAKQPPPQPPAHVLQELQQVKQRVCAIEHQKLFSWCFWTLNPGSRCSSVASHTRLITYGVRTGALQRYINILSRMFSQWFGVTLHRSPGFLEQTVRRTNLQMNFKGSPKPISRYFHVSTTDSYFHSIPSIISTQPPAGCFAENCPDKCFNLLFRWLSSLQQTVKTKNI